MSLTPSYGNIVSNRAKFYRHLYFADYTLTNLKTDLLHIGDCYGYDITTIVILFLRAKLNGKITLTTISNSTTTNDITTIDFQDGQIQFIELADVDTRIGTLLINHGYINKQQLDKALNEKDDSPIGAYLVKKGLITREQIGNVLLAQSRSRLSKLITEQRFSISISDSTTTTKSAELNNEQFHILINDWVLSKFNSEWLNCHYLEYYNFQIQVHWSNISLNETQSFSLLHFFGQDFLDNIEGKKLSDLAIQYENNKNFFKAIHFLCLLKWIQFNPNTPSIENYEIKVKHLYKILMTKNQSEALNCLAVITKQDSLSIEPIYEELQKSFLGPETLINDFKLDVEKKIVNLLINHKQIQSNLNNNVTKNETNTPHVPNSEMFSIKNLLIEQKYNEALIVIKKHRSLLTQQPLLQLYSAWAHLGLATFKNTQISSNTLEKEFISILPEDMTSADFYYVQYLLLKNKKQETPAHNSLKKALELDARIKNYPTVKNKFSWF